MAKKQRVKAGKGKNPAKGRAADDRGGQSDLEAEKEGKPFDFGGLPDRDLKKNLGCG